jgi:succinoglycan biosynthesis transport protein ExoP
VVIVDCTFRRPAAQEGTGRRGRSTKGAGQPPMLEPPAPPDGEDEAELPPPDTNGATADAPPHLTLADAIENDAPLDDIIINTSNPRLSMIQAGAVPVARRPALAQGRPLASLLDQLDERFDHVLLDLPPVLASSDAMNLSQLADAYVLVVRQGSTSEGQVEAALDELQGGETLGVILNRFDSNIPRRLRRLVGT